MADDSQVVTELTLDASGSQDGMVAFEDTLQKIQVLIEQLVQVWTGLNVSFDQTGDKISLIGTSMDGHSQIMKSFTSAASGAASAVTGLGSSSTAAAANSNDLADALTALQRGAQAASSGLGTMGELIAALGAGGAIAIAIAGMKALDDAANSAGDNADKLKTLADSFDLTVEQTQALVTAGIQLDQTQDAISTGLTRFSEQLDGVRQGSGNLFNELMRVNPALTLQMQTTTSMARELSLLAQAYDKAGASQDKLAKTALGSSSLGSLLSSVNDASGVNGLVSAMGQFETATSAQVTQWAALKDEIDQTKAHAEGIFASIFTTEVLQGELSTAKFMDDFAAAAKNFSISGDFQVILDFFSGKGLGGVATILSTIEKVGQMVSSHAANAQLTNSDGSINWLGQPSDSALNAFMINLVNGFKASWQRDVSPELKQFFSDQVGQIMTGAHPQSPMAAGSPVPFFPQPTGPAAALSTEDLDAYTKSMTAANTVIGDFVDAQNKVPLSALAVYNALKTQESALGGAATATEQMTVENAKLAATPGLTAETIARASQYKDFQIELASGQQLLSAGVGNYNDVLAIQNEKFGELIASHPEMTYTQMSQAMGVATLDAQKLWEQLTVKQSPFPGVTQALLNFQDINKTVDTLGTSLLSAVDSGTDSFVKSLSQGVPVAQALVKAAEDFGTAIAGALAKGAIDTALGAIGSALGVGAGGPQIQLQTSATGAATILTTAGQEVGASILAGATAAAQALGLGGVDASTSLTVAGTTTAVPIEVGGATAGTSLAAGGVAAGASLMTSATASSLILAAGMAALALNISLVMGQMEQKAAAQAAAQKAQETWAIDQSEGGSLQQFIEQMTGGVGAVGSSFQQAAAQAQKLADDAYAAGQGIAEINAALATFADTTIRTFIASFDTMIASLNEGLGPDGPAVKAAQNVQQVGTSLLGFIADTKTVATTIGGDTAAITAATQASQAYALSLLQTPPTLDTVQTALLNLQGTASQLQSTLQDLGMSSTQAAAAISQGVNAALAQIATTFSANLTSLINTATLNSAGQGSDYLNQIQALFTQASGFLSDAAALGLNQSQVAQYFQVQAQSIVDNAGLVGDSFNQLIAAFPQLAGIVHESTTAMTQDTQNLLSAYNSAQGLDYINQIQSTIATANTATTQGVDPALVTAYLQAQAQSIVNSAGVTGTAFTNLLKIFPQLTGVVVDANQALAKQTTIQESYFQSLQTSISQYLLKLNTGTGSPLSPTAQVGAAQDAFNQQLALAQGGNGVAPSQDALSSITSYADTLLQSAQSTYASGPQYQAIFQQVTSALSALPKQAESANQQLLDAVNDVTTAVNTTATSVDTVGSNTATTNDILAILQTLNTSTTASSTDISASLVLLGQQSADVANAQSSAYFAPMTSYLATIAGNTAAMIGGSAAAAPSTKTSTTGTLEDVATGAVAGATIGLTVGGPVGAAIGAVVGGVAGFVESLFADGGVVGLYDTGGIVGNGIFNRDSVLAKYKHGGNIGLAGGEHITRATSVNRSTLPTLDYINRQGSPPPSPKSDESANFSVLASTFTRATGAATQMQIGAYREEMTSLRQEVQKLTSTVRSGLRRPGQPGTKTLAVSR